MSSEKHPKPEANGSPAAREGAAGREDTDSIELEERDLFSTWEPPPWDSLLPESAEAPAASKAGGPPQLPPLPPPPALPSLVLPPVPDEALPQLELGMAPIITSNDMSSLAPTVREQPAREPERRSSLRPLIAGLAAFASAGALWIGMPHPEANKAAPQAATAGVADLPAALPAFKEAAPANEPAANNGSTASEMKSAPAVVAAAEASSQAPALRGGASSSAHEISVPAVTIGRAPAPGPRAHSTRRSKRLISSSGPLPDAPRREDVIGALNQLRGQFTACSAGRSGVAEIDLTIAGNGAVANALIGGDFAGTPQGSCLARAIRTARFEPFAQPRSRILYRMAL